MNVEPIFKGTKKLTNDLTNSKSITRLKERIARINSSNDFKDLLFKSLSQGNKTSQPELENFRYYFSKNLLLIKHVKYQVPQQFSS